MLLKALCRPPRHATKRGWEGTTKTKARWNLAGQTLRIMKLTGILLFATALHVTAASTAQTVTYTARTTPLVTVFAAIEKQTGYVFFYNSRDLQGTVPVTVTLKNAPLKEAIQTILIGEPVTFDIQGNTIVITKAAPPTPSENSAAAPPPGDIHGRVVDSLGNPLVGASVFVKGSKKGTSTDTQGNFDLKGVDSKAILIISFTGFESQQIKVEGRNTISVQLLIGATQLLDAVVNKGYYSTSQRLNTGDITTVSGVDINKQPVTDPLLALEGRVPGLYIQQTSGIAGAYSTVQIRGQNSIANGNDPLYVVDGVPFSSVSLTNPTIGGAATGYPNSAMISNLNGYGLSPFNNLNPADIESIVVLKDADATAIYGSRGANGVILITTKKGKAGRTKFDLNAYSGGGKVTRTMNLLNTHQYLSMLREAYANDGLPFPSITTNPGDYNYDIDGLWDTTRYTNWQKTLIGNVANFTNIQGHLSGGNATTQFIIGGGYSKQGMPYIGTSNDQKVSANINLNHTSDNQRFHAQMSASFVNDVDNLLGYDITSFITFAPDAPPLYDQYGNINWAMYNGSSTFNNPLAVTLETQRSVTDNLISNLNLGYRLIDALWIKCSLGYNQSEMNQTFLFPGNAQAPPNNTNPQYRENQQAQTNFKSWIVEPQLEYKKRIANGQLALLIGSTFQERDQNTSATYYSGFAEDALISNPGSATTVQFGGDSYTEYRYEAIYGRIGYDWQEKYLLNLTARRDGSSRFGPGKQFGNFGAIGVGWIFSKEKGMENALPWLSFGKLRASYGVTGNDQIQDYQYLSTYTPNSTTYEGLSILTPTRLANPYFAWEIVKKLEGGLDLGFLKDRILTTASVFRNRCGNQLVGYPLPYTTGFNSIQANLPALVQNSGVELTVTSVNIRRSKFTWTTAFNMTLPSNKLLEFPNLATSGSYSNAYVVGKSIFIRRLYQSNGVNPQTGSYTFATKNADGLPSFPQDLVTTKPVTQKFYGGISNSFSYKGFQLDFLVQFVNQIEYSYESAFGSPGQDQLNEPTAVLSRWQMPGEVTNIQRFGTSSATTTPYSYLQSSTAILTDGSFIRLKNLALSYQFPFNWLTAAHLQSARIYLQCQNLLTWTHYVGLDPETGGLNLPPLRMVTGGIQVTL